MIESTTQRTNRIDDVLGRLSEVAGRPWDSSDGDTPRHRLAEPPWWRRGWVGHLLSRWGSSGVREFGPGERKRVPSTVLIGLVAAGVLVVGVLTAWLTLSGPPAESPPDVPVAVVADHTSSPAAPGVVVDVVGKVAAPGLITLPEGSRVADALRAAGGAQPGADLSTLNQARRVVDGEQLYVGVPMPATAAFATQPGPLDLNTASPIQLDTLPGIGAVTAQRIIDWRTKHGRFAKVDQLREIDGIGQAKLEKLRELVTVR